MGAGWHQCVLCPRRPEHCLVPDCGVGLEGKGCLGLSQTPHYIPGTASCWCHYLWFRLVASAALWGAGLVTSQGLWVTILGCRGNEVIWGRWFGTLWSQTKLSNQPSPLMLALTLRLASKKKMYLVLSLF